MTRSVKNARRQLGMYLRNLREKAKVAPTVLAEKCQVGWNTINRLERGVGSFTQSLVTRFIEGLGISFSEVCLDINRYFEMIFPSKVRGPGFRDVLA